MVTSFDGAESVRQIYCDVKKLMQSAYAVEVTWMQSAVAAVAI